MGRPGLGGKLLRPRVAYLGLPTDVLHRVDDRFWLGALAIEMVHEASLLHDDVVDGASVRRGRPTLAAEKGVGHAVILGDHLLTSAYRAASLTGSPTFLEMFAESVERTVAGEIAQGRARGRTLSMPEYRSIVADKTGRLFGCALASSRVLYGTGDGAEIRSLGERLGSFYQMLDDFLDLCPGAGSGKEPLKDYGGGIWTWPLAELDLEGFDREGAHVVAALFTGSGGSPAPIDRALSRLGREAGLLENDLRRLTPGGEVLARLVHGWVDRAAVARAAGPRPQSRIAPLPIPPYRRQRAAAPDARVLARARKLGEPAAWTAFFARHSRSFRYASLFFPTGPRERVTEVYAYCRFTDDLVDSRPHADRREVEEELDAWSALSRASYEGQPCHVALIDRPMGSMAERGVPFHYAAELIEGVRMDLRPRAYADMAELRTYTYRVASVVGGWLTRLFACDDPWLLSRAFSLGHAMQVTNILRDVGEDLRSGRVYLPRDRMERHGVSTSDLEGMMSRDGVTPAYQALVEELMKEADREYDLALEAVPELPEFFQRPVAVAAFVYRGIHDVIRRNGYDNLTKRARTGTVGKLLLASRAMAMVRRARTGSSGPVRLRPHLSLVGPDRLES